MSIQRLLTKARIQVLTQGVISYDTAVALMGLGCDVGVLEGNFRKEHGFD